MLKKYSKLLIISGFVLLAVLVGYFYIQYQKYYPRTDDAYIKAYVIQVAPQVSGQVASVNIQNQQFVKKGQVLLTIDKRPFEIAYNQANAVLINTEKNTSRTLALVAKKLASPAAGDEATSNLQVAKANFAKAELDLQYTTITAPTDGYIANFNLHAGADITAYQPLFALIANHTWWASANFKETDLPRIKVGQSATITLDMYPDHKFQGKVIGVSYGSGDSFSILPPENATGNWVKVTQRFPVDVEIVNNDSKYPLRVGASATVIVNTK